MTILHLASKQQQHGSVVVAAFSQPKPPHKPTIRTDRNIRAPPASTTALGSASTPDDPTDTTKRLVLVGGGHAHAQVLRALNKQSRPKDLHVTLIDQQTSACYSGMVPGCVAKLYTAEETLLHLKPLCDWAGIDFRHDEVVDIDLDAKQILLRGVDEPVRYDAVSIDIGSASRGLDSTPGAKENTIPTRPISELVRRIEMAESDLGSSANVVVIGGGAAGIELSMSMMGRWGPILNDQLTVTLLHGGDELLPNESESCRAKLLEQLKTRGVQVVHNCNVQAITDTQVLVENGDGFPYTHCLWATGAGAHPLASKLREKGLAVTDRGWIRVDENLQSISHPSIFAAGDCCSMEGLKTGPPPKAGVYAVRSGPVLIENLTRYFQPNVDLEPYNPQDDFLKLLVCGDGTAVGFRFGVPLYGKWVFTMKDRIDVMFMDLFKEENFPVLEDGAEVDTSQYDAVADHDRIPLPPTAAAELIRREDDGVDYLTAWNVIRDMTKDTTYREEVLQQYHSQISTPVPNV